MALGRSRSGGSSQKDYIVCTKMLAVLKDKETVYKMETIRKVRRQLLRRSVEYLKGLSYDDIKSKLEKGRIA